MNFLIKIFSPSLLMTSISILIYTFYRSEISFSGEERDYYFIYYLVAIFLIISDMFTIFGVRAICACNNKLAALLIASVTPPCASNCWCPCDFGEENNGRGTWGWGEKDQG